MFAGARSPSKSTALNALAKEYPHSVRVVQLTSADAEDNKAAVEEIERQEGQLDVIIANAGIADYFGPLTTTPVEQFTSHFNINTVGVIVLFQAAYPLLRKSPTGAPRFSVISSLAGSIGVMLPLKSSA